MAVKYLQAMMRLERAREHLQLPHPDGEAASIRDAFVECSAILHDLRRHGADVFDMDEATQDWVVQLEALMDTSGIDDLAHRGTYAVKAEQFTLEEKYEIREAVNALAAWADERFRTEGG